VDVTPEVDTCVTTRWQDVVLGKLLTMPEHRRSLAGEERDGEGLQLIRPAAVRQRRLARLPTHEPDEAL
jgi:hypothetical protein